MADTFHLVSALHGSIGQFDSQQEANAFAKRMSIPIGNGYSVKKNYGQQSGAGSAAKDILGGSE